MMGYTADWMDSLVQFNLLLRGTYANLIKK